MEYEIGTSRRRVYQAPGAFERTQNSFCTRMVGCHLLDGTGHWVQQERPQAVSGLLIDFMRAQGAALDGLRPRSSSKTATASRKR
jgi:hypothetical protein